MYPTETEILHNFCPQCMKKSKSILYCTSCGGGDLIAEPEIKLTFHEPIIGQLSSKESNLKIGVDTATGKDQTVVAEVDESGNEIQLLEFNEDNLNIIAEGILREVDKYNIADPIEIIPREKSFVELVEDEVDKRESVTITDENRFHFLTGAGGTGKTFLIRKRADDNPRYIELCSTTGIAAINLGGRTINSTLGYYNTKSLHRNWESGLLQQKLRKVRQNKDVLGIEECSMLSAEQLDIIMNAVDEINNDRSGKQLGVHLIGDFAQLPPVAKPPEIAEFCFKADNWPQFIKYGEGKDKSIERLTKIWRQDNPDFIAAINAARKGDGNTAVTMLLDCGVRFEDKVDGWFNGTTLIPKNADVDFYNTRRLNQINNPMLRSVAVTAGTPANEWKNHIPLELRLKKEACVMILANDVPNFNYVNGDIGWIKDYDQKKDSYQVELKRTGACVNIGRIRRFNLTDRYPNAEYFKAGFSPYVDNMTGDWVIGTISYHPLRLAYASTIHKSQGLSLDLVQINTSAWFFGSPNMAYVALSRARTPEGLIIVGKPQDVARKIVCHPEVKKWI